MGSGLSACRLCFTGSQTSAPGRISCRQCSSGSYGSGSGLSICTACTPGSYLTGSGSSACSLCPEASYASAFGSSVCSICSAGNYATGTGSFICIKCAAGQYAMSSGSSTCESCSEGTFAKGAGSLLCSSCLPGTFATGSGFSYCTHCYPGSHATASGATTSSICILCSTGTYTIDTATSICISCTPGTYSTTPELTTCSRCPPGTFATGTEASACAICQKGTFSAVTGASASSVCSPCPHGTYSTLLGATNSLTCSVQDQAISMSLFFKEQSDFFSTSRINAIISVLAAFLDLSPFLIQYKSTSQETIDHSRRVLSVSTRLQFLLSTDSASKAKLLAKISDTQQLNAALHTQNLGQVVKSEATDATSDEPEHPSIVGISVGIAVAVLVAGSISAYLYYRHRSGKVCLDWSSSNQHLRIQIFSSEQQEITRTPIEVGFSRNSVTFEELHSAVLRCIKRSEEIMENLETITGSRRTEDFDLDLYACSEEGESLVERNDANPTIQLSSLLSGMLKGILKPRWPEVQAVIGNLAFPYSGEVIAGNNQLLQVSQYHSPNLHSFNSISVENLKRLVDRLCMLPYFAGRGISPETVGIEHVRQYLKSHNQHPAIMFSECFDQRPPMAAITYEEKLSFQEIFSFVNPQQLANHGRKFNMNMPTDMRTLRIWIDVLFLDQLGLDLDSNKTLTEMVFIESQWHFLLATSTFFINARCFFELAVRYKTGRDSILILSTKYELSQGMISNGNFFDDMTTAEEDIEIIRTAILDAFESPDRFNQVVRIFFINAGGRWASRPITGPAALQTWSQQLTQTPSIRRPLSARI